MSKSKTGTVIAIVVGIAVLAGLYGYRAYTVYQKKEQRQNRQMQNDLKRMRQQEEEQRELAESAARGTDEDSFFRNLHLKSEAAGSKIRFTESGLGYEILRAGDSFRASDDDAVIVSYQLTLADGRVADEGKEMSFPLKSVISGFSEGLKLIGPGGRIKLYVPSKLGYGASGIGGADGIPPYSPLIFDVTLHGIK